MDSQKPRRTPKTGGPETLLASLFSTILRDCGVTVTDFRRLVEHWVRQQAASANRQEDALWKSSLFSNLTKDLASTTMTIKKFVRNVQYLGCKRITITISLLHYDGRETNHSVRADLTQMEAGEDE